jgi:DNA-binding transcriptional LysR family regulator
MNLRKLRVFIAVVRARSFSAAASTLCISQPAVSRAIKDLESELDCALLSRGGNKVFMTRAGETLFEHAVAMLDLEKSALKELRRQKGLEEGELVIGATRNVGTYYLPALIARFLGEHPLIDMHIASDNREAIQQRLLSFELDVAFIEEQIEDSRIDCRYWRDEKLVILAEHSSPLLASDQLDTRGLSAETWILSEPRSGLREQSLQLLSDAGIRVSKTLEVEGSGTIIQCVGAGLGVSLISERAAKEHLMAGHVAIVPCPIEFHRPLFMAKMRAKPTSPPAEAFISVARDIL